MFSDRVVLCGASAYEQKYYFNQDFDALPQQIKDELQILCVMYTEEIGGVLTLEFDEDGNLEFKTDNTALFDFAVNEVEPAGWNIDQITYDLHHDPVLCEGNIMTEYEEKFSSMGNPICKMIINR